jgi:hypothetical protein
MTSSKGFCAVLCTWRALPPHSSPPSAASLGSPMAPSRLTMAPPPARALEGTSSWPCPKASPSPTCPSSTPFPSTPYRPPPPRQEQPQPDETTRSAPHMQEWSKKWLRLLPLLRGVVRTYRTTGDEAPASARRRGRRPWRHHTGVLRSWHPAGAERRPM